MQHRTSTLLKILDGINGALPTGSKSRFIEVRRFARMCGISNATAYRVWNSLHATEYIADPFVLVYASEFEGTQCFQLWARDVQAGQSYTRHIEGN